VQHSAAKEHASREIIQSQTLFFMEKALTNKKKKPSRLAAQHSNHRA
jgi:hypothetical protein